MAISIQHLPDGGASLEFGPGDVAAVRAAITARYGKMRRRWFVLAAEVTFGGEQFAFQNEWSDPCLIARSERASAMLERIADDLGA